MCGICGWIGPAPPRSPRVTTEMAGLLVHRGPDDAGVEEGPGWSLGFRRLSILDLSPLGHQPMRSPDGRCWLVFNGEIYNFRELRRDLEADGERFRSAGDTEVLLRLLMREGVAALPRLNGMFALAFVNTGARTFLLARDRLGVKPLYFARQRGHLRFASELKALVAAPDVPRSIDPAAVAQYLTLGYLPEETCIFEGCAKVPAGHVLEGTIDAPETASLRSYWQLSLNDDPTDRAVTTAELDELDALLLDATRIRLRSDVPVGVFLSGGLDSGLVAAFAARTGLSPLALTVGFAEQGFDESERASLTAQHVGLPHRIVAQRSGGLADIDRLAYHFDEPFGDPSALPTFTLCEAAAAHATVFLSGDGGDEAFGGYRRYVMCRRRRALIEAAGRLGAPLRSLGRLLPQHSLTRYRVTKLSLTDQGCAAAFDELLPDPVLDAVVHPDLRPLLAASTEPLWRRWRRSRADRLTTRQQRLDYDLYLPDDVLVKVDRASMAHSIEVRSPFLDVRLVEWAARLPRAALLDGIRGKLPLRALGARLLPPAIEAGAKQGFGVPLDAWFRAPIGRQVLLERLTSPDAGRADFLSHSGIEWLLAQHCAERGRGYGLLLWRLLMLDAWSRQHAERRPAAPAVLPLRGHQPTAVRSRRAY